MRREPILGGVHGPIAEKETLVGVWIISLLVPLFKKK
jgi:hypothetical protein